MKLRILTVAALSALFCGVLPARAADPEMMKLVMPDAKVIAGINVQQARNSPFGQYLLSQSSSQDADMQQFATLAGFDPRRDINEILVASTGAPKGGAVVLARGFFDVGKVNALAQQKGVSSLQYAGVTILQDKGKANGVALVDNTLAILGDLASIRAALDRRTAPGSSSISPSLSAQVSEWSQQDAWVVSAVPPGSYRLQGMPPQLGQQPSIQSIKQVAAGVKFGSLLEFAMRAEADTSQNASALGGALQLIANMFQMQASQANQQAASLLKSLAVNTSGNTVTLNWSIPETQLEQMIQAQRAKAKQQANPAGPAARRPGRQM